MRPVTGLLFAAVALGLAGAAPAQLDDGPYGPAADPAQPKAVAAKRPTTTRSDAGAPAPAATGTLHEAWRRLLEKQFEAAIPLFDEVIRSDAHNVSAREGRGICRYELSKYHEAEPDVENALTRCGKDSRLSRQATLAAAVVAMQNGKPLRAVKLARDALASLDKQGAPDEELQNVLGAALWRCKPHDRALPLLRESGRFYMAYEEKLAAERNATLVKTKGDVHPSSYDLKSVAKWNEALRGERRWGPRWLPADEADHKWAQYAEAIASADAASAKLSVAVGARKAAELRDESAHSITEPHTYHEMNHADNNARKAVAVEAAARAEFRKTVDQLRKTEAPPFPAKIKPRWVEPG